MKMLSIASVGIVGLSAVLSLVAYGQMSMGAATNDRRDAGGGRREWPITAPGRVLEIGTSS